MKIEEFIKIDNTALIEVDEIPFKWKCGGQVLIDNKEYDATIVYDLPNNIAVFGVGDDDLIDKELKFV